MDTIVTSQLILESFDAAGIDIDSITGIQRKASQKSLIATFANRAAKETALETPHVEISGLKIFLGDCENRLSLVKIYDAPAELPDTALIGRLSHYGQVLSFRRDKIGQHIDNGIRPARMIIKSVIPSYMNVAGEIVRVWYPNQPKTCRNCGGEDHMARDCSSVHCFLTASALVIGPATAQSLLNVQSAWRKIIRFSAVLLRSLAQMSRASIWHGETYLGLLDPQSQ